jgi:hypothetical protein
MVPDQVWLALGASIRSASQEHHQYLSNPGLAEITVN